MKTGFYIGIISWACWNPCIYIYLEDLRAVKNRRRDMACPLDSRGRVRRQHCRVALEPSIPLRSDSIYLSVCLPTYLSIYPYIYQFVYVSVCLITMYLSVCLSICLSAFCMFVHLSTYCPLDLFVRVACDTPCVPQLLVLGRSLSTAIGRPTICNHRDTGAA